MAEQPVAQAKVPWGWLIAALLVGVIGVIGALQGPLATPTPEERQAQFESNERTHCQMFGEPSEEGRLIGYQCP